MLEQRIQTQFFESADLKYQAADALARPVAQAAQMLVTGLTSGGRVLVAGLGGSATLALWLAQALIGRHERDRPGLAAIALGADGVALAAIGAAAGPEQVLARQIEALGHPGDLLVLLREHEAHDTALLAAVVAAQQREMTVLAITGKQPGAVGAALADTDLLVAVPHERLMRVREMQLLVLHCLCDAIDLQLLGEEDPE